MSHPATDNRQPTHTPVGLIAFAWTLVGVPLAYGLYNTVKAATAHFGGGAPHHPTRRAPVRFSRAGALGCVHRRPTGRHRGHVPSPTCGEP